jgi:LPXTG-motif cell wall-anchored protein
VTTTEPPVDTTAPGTTIVSVDEPPVPTTIVDVTEPTFAPADPVRPSMSDAPSTEEPAVEPVVEAGHLPKTGAGDTIAIIALVVFLLGGVLTFVSRRHK